jgi:hypothetical protein
MTKAQSKKTRRETRPARVTKRYRPKPSPGEVTMRMVADNLKAVLKKLTASKVEVVTPHRAVVRIQKVDLDAEIPAQSTTISQEAFEPNARARALLEGVRIAQEDLRKAGGAYDLEQVRTLMQGVSRQAVDKRVQEGSLLAVPGPSNRRSYPTLQFNRDGTVVDGLKAVCEVIPTANPWTILNFLAQPDDRLHGQKPIDVLKEGNVDLVVEAARRMGQQGA